ncbi:MAG: hypothetical protein IT256_03515, partial [Chitinophagaceae bacterium]|nr:hypothetical protein [Chitinophagaceae bacterium]
MTKVFLYIVFFFSMAYCNAQLQENNFIFSNPAFQNYTIKNGLLFNYINGLLQDKRGYIWIATKNGLSRFNGNKWVEFQQQNGALKHRLPSNWVVDITEDYQSNIWIKTDNGVCKYDTEKDSIIFFPEIIKGWGKIVFAKPYNLYISSWSGIEHYQIEGNKLIHKKSIIESANNSILHLCNDTINNMIWACPEDHPTLMSINTQNEEFQHL